MGVEVSNLPACHSRRDWDETSGTFFCAHPNVHTRDNLVRAAICQSCTKWQEPAPEEVLEPGGTPTSDRCAACLHLGRTIRLDDCASCKGSVKIKVFACGHPEHAETTYRGCLPCRDYEPPLRRVQRWSVGMTTAPRRESTIERSLSSLAAAGWDRVRLFAEPGSMIPEGFRHLPVVWRESRLGAWANWLLALVQMYLREPAADAYFLVQDDVVYCRDLRSYLEQQLWPSPSAGVVSVYCSSKHDPGNEEAGFVRIPPQDGLIGAVACVFPTASVRSLLAFSGVHTHHLGSGPAAQRDIDGVVGRWAGARGREVHCHVPSLAQHVGEASTIWDGLGAVGRRQAGRFVGEEAQAGPPECCFQELSTKEQQR